MQTCIQAIAERAKLLDQAITKGEVKGEGAIALGHKYAWSIAKDALGIATLGIDPVTCGTDAIEFTVSTQNPDRDGDVVRSKGCRLQAYTRNPIWMFGHGAYMFPIGKAKAPDGQICVTVLPNLIRAKCHFDMKDQTAAFLKEKVEGGFLNATSIAFVPLSASQREQIKEGLSVSPVGWEFSEWDLTEISLVPVPANSEAIRNMLDAEKSFITPHFAKCLESYAAVAKGRCFSGWCPCPEEKKMPKTKLPSKKTKCGCKESETCDKCKAKEEVAAVVKSPLQESVDAKLPKLVEAGYSSEGQAQAIAFHLYTQGKAGDDIAGHDELAIRLGYKSAPETVTKTEEEKPLEESRPAESEVVKDEDTETEGMKHSVEVGARSHEHLRELGDYLDRELPKMDHEKRCGYFTKFRKNLEEHCADHHGQYDEGELAKGIKALGDPGEEEVVKEETTEETVEEYRHPPKALTAMKDAAEYLTDLAKATDIPKRYRSGLSYHAKELQERAVEKAPAIQVVVEPAVSSAVTKAFEEVKNLAFQVTGIRV